VKGYVKQRSPGSWGLRFDLPPGPNGERRQKRVTFKGTKAQAEAEFRRILRELDTGTFIEPSKTTVADLLERWLKATEPRVAKKTAQDYRDIVNDRLIPRFGSILLVRLAPLAIEDFYGDLRTSGRRDGKGGLSERSIAYIHRVLSMALAQGVKWQLLLRNPCEAVTSPRAKRTEQAALDEQGTVQLLGAAEGTPLALPILLSVTCGLRRSELCGLRWEDVDLTGGRIFIRQAVVLLRTGVEVKEPKTDKGRRVIALPPLVGEALRRHREEQQLQKLTLGPLWQDSGRVVTMPDGTGMSPNYLTKAFIKLCRHQELPPVRLHDLRHSHASQLLKAGVPLTAVSARLGHSSVTVTGTIYAHLLGGMDEDAAQRVDSALRAAMGG
jgi:integrase